MTSNGASALSDIADEDYQRGTRKVLAILAFCRVDGNGGNAAHVDANRRQDPPHPNAVDESLVARHSLSHSARPNDFTSSARSLYIRDQFRFYRSPVAHREQRWPAARDRIAATFGCRFLPRGDEDVGWTGAACDH